MKRLSTLASLAAVGGVAAFQGSYVDLQTTTPGTAQTGHSNITGTARAGSFRGNGSLLTNLNASELRTGIITLTGASSTYMIRAANNDGSPNASALIGLANSPTGITYGAWAETKSTEGRALFGYASATSGATYASYAVNNSTGGRAAFGLAQATNGTNYGGWFQSNSPIGVGTYARNIAGGTGLRAESAGMALEVLGNASFTNLATFAGSVGIGNSSPAWPLHITSNQLTLVRAEGTATTGQTSTGYFSTNSDGGNAILARANASTGSASALRAQNSSPGGFALLAEGNANVSGNVGIGAGAVPVAEKLRVKNDSAAGLTVAIENGINPTQFAPDRRALIAQARGSSAYVYGSIGTAESTAMGTTYGVFGYADGGSVNCGVYGLTNFGTENYAGYFQGKLYAVSANSGIKAFMIDHPMDPANKVLMHSSVESDERKNIYDGTITTDNRGFATITMPTWFEALNENFRYQITVIDDENSEEFVLAKVVKRLKNGRFTIRTSAPRTTVSWQVTGNRHDPLSKSNPLEVEREKTPVERGKYFAPEAFGRPKELSIIHVPTVESPTQARRKRG